MRDSPERDSLSFVRYGLGVWPDTKIVGASSPLSSASDGFTGGLSPPGPPPCLISKEEVLAQIVQEPKRSKPMVQMGRKSTGSNPAVFPDSQVIPECLVLQYFQIHRSYQNAWSFSISRFRGPQNAWSSDAQSISSDTQHQRYKFRHPKYKFRQPKYSQTP